MKLKSFLTKLIPAKRDSSSPLPEYELEALQQEIPLQRLDDSIEKIDGPGLDVYINGRQANIHSLATETKIGRDPSQSDIIISELIVSKLHCTIYSSGDDFYIKDNKSTNGVYVNREKISADRQIKHGDVIRLGKRGTVTLVFHNP
jgi:pSer/pThr/pTyr-binding forkhead associated (FHA) protein